MKSRPKQPTVPGVMYESVRRELLAALKEGQQSAKELSSRIGISEKDVYDHLEHIRKSAHNSGQRLAVVPAECKKCGFVFSKRERLKKPGRCPVCRGESIHAPLFSVEQAEEKP